MNTGKCTLKIVRFSFSEASFLIFRCVKPSHTHAWDDRWVVATEGLYDVMLNPRDPESIVWWDSDDEFEGNEGLKLISVAPSFPPPHVVKHVAYQPKQDRMDDNDRLRDRFEGW